MDDAWDRYKNFQSTIQRGHHYHTIKDPYTAKERSHDDGKETGLFLGGIGAPVCSRSLDGRFSRWHMQTGVHVQQPLDEAFIRIRWRAGDSRDSMRLDQAEADSRNLERSVYSLFPVMHESYSGGDMPFDAVLESFSPLLPQDNHTDPGAAILPVWYVTVTVKNTGDLPADIDTAFFFPNMLGWKTQRMTSTERPVKSWPGQTHAGNTAVLFSPAGSELLDAEELSERVSFGRGVLQQRNSDRPVMDDMEGQAAIISFTNETGLDHSSCFSHSYHSYHPYHPYHPSAVRTHRRCSAEACFKAGQNLVEKPLKDQKHTIAWLEQYFAEQGTLPESGLSWEAHWDEALGSAVSQGKLLEAGESASFDFCIVFDLPIITFGSGRKWYRKYTETFGSSGKNAQAIAVHAASIKDACRNEIDRWQNQVLESNTHLPPSVKAAMLNELYFINGGGSAWVSRCMDQSREGIRVPLLGDGEHAGLLEGYDIGYYYY
ncbi:MAG: hypothetical protein K9K78_06105, partial [Spirochaetales bacterium]|nr:hypothetical protein [Spirochaetales bacterium]